MIPAVIILCNGIDNSLDGLKLDPFIFARISANDPYPIESRKLPYVCKAECYPDGTAKEINKESTTVNTLYDLIQHLFPPYSSARTRYLQTEQYWDGAQYQYKAEPERFACFFSDSDNCWEKDQLCLLDAIRLFKLNRAGFGLSIHTRGGIGLNDLYKLDTNTALWKNPPHGLPIFSLDENDRSAFQEFYLFYRRWFSEENPGEKDQVARKLLDLYRMAYNAPNSDTSLMILSQIWELFAQYFPDQKNKTKNTRGVSMKIKECVSKMVRNGPATKKHTANNLYGIVRYLYKQRCILVHQDPDGEFNPACISVAFDISRCLILKLIYTKDAKMKDIVSKIDGCEMKDVPYPDDRVKCNPIDPNLLEEIFKPTSERICPHV